MKRGGPLKRTGTLARGTGLVRSGGHLAAGGELARTGSLKSRPKPAPPKAVLDEIAEQRARARRIVFARSGGLCVVSGKLAVEYHHVVPVELLTYYHFELEIWNPDDGIALAADVHADHTSAHRRVPYELLPDVCLRFAQTRKLDHVIDAHYPKRKQEQ